METELNSSHNSSTDNFVSAGRIVKFAKGPFGLVTLAALVIVVALPFLGHKPVSSTQVAPTLAKNQIQIISYQGKEIPLSQLRIGHAHIPNCDADHYHALNTSTETVTALDGTVLYDPGNCGFGKVEETKVTSVSQ